MKSKYSDFRRCHRQENNWTSSFIPSNNPTTNSKASLPLVFLPSFNIIILWSRDWKSRSDNRSSLCNTWKWCKRSSMCWISGKRHQYLFTLRMTCSTHQRGLVRFRISDRKFVNHTTEMILWSMILNFCSSKEHICLLFLKPYHWNMIFVSGILPVIYL